MEKNIILKKVQVHNLKGIDLSLNTNQLIIFTGVSGSGKSSLAFDTLYIEGQRRYIESLSTYARRQLGEMNKPDIETASGLSPTIAIEQKSAGKNPRSTVGTLTEIYDYLRVLFARVGVPHCPISGEPVRPQSRERIIKVVQSLPKGTKIIIFAPYVRGRKGEFKEDFIELMRKGFTKVRVDQKLVNLSDEITLDGSLAHDIDILIDRIAVEEANFSRIAESLTTALELGQGVCSVFHTGTEEEQLFSMHAYSPKSGLSYHSLEPHDFSFNSPSGMCPRCSGMGICFEFDLDLIIQPDLSISEDCCTVASSYQTVKYGNIYDNLAHLYGFSVKTPWKKLSEKAKQVFLYGTEKKWTRMLFTHPETGATWVDHVMWKGVLFEAHRRYAEATSEGYKRKIEKLMHEEICPECKGSRLKPFPSVTQLQGIRIQELTSLTVLDALKFFESLKLEETDRIIAEELLKEICTRLHFLIEVGLHYLTLDRTAPTLSGGEAQRVRLASQIGCGLVGITYILDEPSIGLHPRDNKKLIHTLKHLRDMGNTIVVVEHDEETIWEADQIVDFGPGPGSRGGNIVVNGTVADLLSAKDSITGAYLKGERVIPIPKKRRKTQDLYLEIKGATHHNLKQIDVKFPLGLFIAVTGVSGSGKSSLVTDILYPVLSNHLHHSELKVGAYKECLGMENLDKVIAIDQTPIGRNPRSNPATYIKLFDNIRDLFCELPESKARGYKPGRFSFNVKEGSCPECEGMGMTKIDMDFMEAAWVDCALCKGHRFDQETLSIQFKGKSIYDVLEMEVGQALELFEHLPTIKHKLETLHQVGMEYIKLGQSSTTLSGGEAQRIKLAKELVRPSTGKTLYIFDEPTTGLHFHDIKHLLEVLHELVERGNTVIVIEHNMDVVKTADWIIDLGPEGGIEGGNVIATGTPEKIAKMETPTGNALKEVLYHDIEAKVKSARAQKKKKEKQEVEGIKAIHIENAEQNNLKNINVTIPREKITICTGPSGSGKSSLAFETIYAEGQRRYIESLSPYARQFVKQMPKPKVGHVDGLSPAVAIEQKAHAGNPRSTVGTMTEIYDYLRVLYARIGIAHDPETGEEIRSISKDYVIDLIMSYPKEEKIQILAPLELKKQETFEDLIKRLQKQGFLRIRLNGTYHELDQNNIPYDRKRKNELYLVIDRLKVNPTMQHRLAEAIELAASISNQKLIVVREDKDVLFNLSFAVESTGKSFQEITPHTFAFNTSEGMCLDCQGLGIQYGANLAQKKELMNQSISSLIRYLWLDQYSFVAFGLFEIVLKTEKIDPYTSLSNLSAEQLNLIMNGTQNEKWYMSKQGFRFRWIGVNNVLAKAGKSARQDHKELLIPLLEELECPSCSGARINPLARHVTIKKLPIQNLCSLPIEQVYAFIQNLNLKAKESKVLEEVLEQLHLRLKFLCNVGLHYISLDRRATTLSGGETQRIRLSRQLGSGLTGVLYVLDEPTIGLHPHDNSRLNDTLLQLKKLGNTLILVEHDPLTISIADHIIDFGPHAGQQGGHIMAQGSLKQIMKNPKSLTGAYLSGKKTIPIPKTRRSLENGLLSIKNASMNNLKNISVDIPIKALTCLTGVSGSGKSTLMHQVILPAIEKGLNTKDVVELPNATVSGISQFDRFISIDQNPIGHTVRSDVCTYVEVLTRMRELFASLPQAQLHGLQPKHFSYNHRKGMCTACWGLGYKRVYMQFLPPVKVVCEDCKGLRLNPVSLQVTYDNKNLGQYLDSTIEEVRAVFANHPRITRILDTLISVGLGYLKLGQEMVSLSGGEAQRIKLSRELAKRSTGNTLYLLDEPTTGLHSDDIQKLLTVLHKLVDKGNTMLIIEHQTDVIKNADFVIDLGPEAGEKGGYVVATGTPEEIGLNPNSLTGKYLGS